MSEERPQIDPVMWIKARLSSGTVYQEGEGGKWKARFQATELGEFNTQAEALKAYRKAAEEHFHQGAVLPTEEQIDQAGVVTVTPLPRRPPPAPAQPQHPSPRRRS